MLNSLWSCEQQRRTKPSGYGWAVGGPRRPLWLGTSAGMAADGQPSVVYHHFKPAHLRSLSSRKSTFASSAVTSSAFSAPASPRVSRALTVGSKVADRAAFSAHGA